MQMIDRNALKGEIAKRGIKKKELANELAITPQELSNKLSGVHYFNESQMFVLYSIFGEGIFHFA